MRRKSITLQTNKIKHQTMNIVFIEPLGVCECTFHAAVAALQAQGHQITFYKDRREDEDTLIERAKDAEIIAVSNIPLRKNFFEHCPCLKMLSVAFTGVDHIDIEECRKRGITVCNAAGYSTQAVAELAIGMMIAVYRKIVGGDAITRISGDRQGILGSELGGKTVGIIGLGAIGQRVAQLAAAFGCRILAYNRSPKNLPGITQVDKNTLLSQADIITLHLPLTADTRNFLQSEDFALMRPHAILINTARGPIVNQNALYEALRKGKIAGAALDVYDQEPPLPADCELFNAPNLLMLPHLGFATHEAFASRFDIVVKNMENWLAGTPQNKIC